MHPVRRQRHEAWGAGMARVDMGPGGEMGGPSGQHHGDGGLDNRPA